MPFRKITTIDSIRKFYSYYTKDFNYSDIEKLFKQDAPGVFDFYVSRMKQPANGNKSLSGKIFFLRNLFLEFLMQLTPARRIIYTLTLILFVLGYLNNNWQWAVFSFILINLLIAFELADKLTAKDELSVARDIQNGLMPNEAPASLHYDICGYSESAREVGGDYFDFIPDEKNKSNLYLVIGDISGKGMAAAIHMLQVRSILHNLIFSHETPRSILTALNLQLKKVLRAGTFFTVIIASLNEQKQIKLCRAGHLPLIHYSRKENSCINVIPTGMGIGLTENKLFESILEEKCLDLSIGDILFFYTDGIVEAMNEYLLEFGEKKLKEIIVQNAYKPAKMIKESVLESIQAFTRSAPRHDDLTMIIIKVL